MREIHAAARRGALGFPGLALAGCLAAILVTAGGAGCARVSVHTMSDPQADFTRYATFRILPRGGATLQAAPPRRLRVLDDPAFHDELARAIATALAEKGLRAVSRDADPDLVVGYQIAVRNQAEVLPPIYGAGWRGHLYLRHPAQVHWYKEGTLVIDLVDAGERDLLWRGVGVGAMRDLHPGEALEEAVREILEGFPPGD